MGNWNAVGTGLWVRVYHFRDNPLNTLAIDIGNGGLAVLSPGTDVPDADFAELDALGTVKALVSPGAFHNMGLPLWSERYPDAGVYGPKKAAAHIKKAQPSLKPLQDFDTLAPLLPSDVRIMEMPDMKQPDVLAVIRRDDAITWFTNECLSNMPSLPGNFLVALLFRITGSGPGLNVNTLVMKFIGAKKKNVREFFLSKLASDPPTRLIPCHGDIIDDSALQVNMREMIERRLG